MYKLRWLCNPEDQLSPRNYNEHADLQTIRTGMETYSMTTFSQNGIGKNDFHKMKNVYKSQIRKISEFQKNKINS